MTAHLVDFVTGSGLVAVFVLMALESCGIPIPSELIMPVAGALAAGALGGVQLSAWEAVLAGALGNLAGSLVAYVLAARFGEAALLGPGRYVGISRNHVALADRLFARRGLLLVFVGRMLPVVRTYISFPAGMARVDPVRFGLLTFAGALPWCAALTAAGYAVGRDYDRVNGPVSKAAIVVGVLVLAGLAAWFIKGRTQRAEAAPVDAGDQPPGTA